MVFDIYEADCAHIEMIIGCRLAEAEGYEQDY